MRRRVAANVGIVLAFVLALTSGAGRPAAQGVLITGTTIQLTTNLARQLDPSISGTIVVFTDQRNGNDDVYYCHVSDCGGTEVQVMNSTSPQRLHDVSGNIIVYSDLSPPEAHVRAYDTTTNSDTGVVGVGASQNAKTDGSVMVYESGPPGGQDIWMTDLTTGESSLVASTSAQELNAAVSGSRIVLERHAAGGGPGEIVVYDIATGHETAIAAGQNDYRRPDIDGNVVVYDGTTDAGDLDIFIYNIATGLTTCLPLPGNQRVPHVSGDVIVFNDDSAGNPDVTMYHIPTGTFHAVATAPGSDFLNDISGNRIVYGSDAAGNSDIWLYTFDIQLPEIDVAPLAHDFGDITIGASESTVVTISNVGSQPLTVSAIDFDAGSSAAFTMTASPVLPAAIAAGGTVDVHLRFSPATAGTLNASLDITSDDLDEPLVHVALSGLGIDAPPPTPAEQIADLLAFFDDAVVSGGLAGNGPGNSAHGRLDALRNMIRAAGDLVERGLFGEACQQLFDAYRRTDSVARPPDFVSGSAAAELAQRIQTVRASLGCL